MARRLNKYLYKKGLRCERLMWEESRHYGTMTDAEEMRMRSGIMVGERARELFPDGVLVPAGPDAVKETALLIEQECPVIFEATFEADDQIVRADILEYQGGNVWDLTEVKSKLRFDKSVLADFLKDLAPQVHVISQFLTLGKVKVKHISRDYDGENLASLFVDQDLTNSLANALSLFASKQAVFSKHLASEDGPKPVLTKECRSCAFFDRCWPDFPDENIFHIPRAHHTKLSRWINEDRLDLKDIRQDELTPKQTTFYASYKKQDAIVDKDRLRAYLSELVFPISYLDFESVNPVMPLVRGASPSSHFVFQYSIHREDKNGQLEHFSFLEPDLEDPRPEMATRLLKDLCGSGSIVSHNAAFEKSQIKTLAMMAPDKEEALLALLDRFWDTEPIFKNGTYSDWRLRGGSSIKAVLPLLTDSSYEGLDVQDGSNAQAAYMELLNCRDADKRNELAIGLEKYCKKDTEAMLDIVNALRRLI